MSSRAAVQAQWPIVLVGLIFAAALVLVGANFWRRGSLLIGVGVGVAAALRLVLSDERAGLLVVREQGHRLLDHRDGRGGDGLHRLDHRPVGHRLDPRHPGNLRQPGQVSAGQVAHHLRAVHLDRDLGEHAGHPPGNAAALDL